MEQDEYQARTIDARPKVAASLLHTRILACRTDYDTQIENASSPIFFNRATAIQLKSNAVETMNTFQNELIHAITPPNADLTDSQCLTAVKALYERPGYYGVKPNDPEPLRNILAQKCNKYYEASLSWLNQHVPASAMAEAPR